MNRFHYKRLKNEFEMPSSTRLKKMGLLALDPVKNYNKILIIQDYLWELWVGAYMNYRDMKENNKAKYRNNNKFQEAMKKLEKKNDLINNRILHFAINRTDEMTVTFKLYEYKLNRKVPTPINHLLPTRKGTLLNAETRGMLSYYNDKSYRHSYDESLLVAGDGRWKSVIRVIRDSKFIRKMVIDASNSKNKPELIGNIFYKHSLVKHSLIDLENMWKELREIAQSDIGVLTMGGMRKKFITSLNRDHIETSMANCVTQGATTDSKFKWNPLFKVRPLKVNSSLLINIRTNADSQGWAWYNEVNGGDGMKYGKQHAFQVYGKNITVRQRKNLRTGRKARQLKIVRFTT